MAKFQKRQVVVEAEQYAPNMAVLPPGVTEVSEGEDGTGHISAYVTTIHGQRTDVVPGDWIIAEPDGIHYYPCKPDIFAERYEPAEEALPVDGLNLQVVMAALYNSEIDCGIESCWDMGWSIWIDEPNDYEWVALKDAAIRLHELAIVRHPNSDYARKASIAA